ncbi:helix-turn-helix domain-containing protein [Kibdelosporangium aridum]|uniref:Helix-turn-helix domain-containing protein n=1 Tax=Kibdelosporangium aridum TaxID=2030 RepID=A0A1Y5XGW1_KIBAR|nr:helix-turn-helix domain-containing protein [Kibdelosporangium aridum]SMC88166.1 Helix-turn-helix domain-containing protein [Kibdelosporangium aridum]
MELDERLAALEERVAALEGRRSGSIPEGTFWALEGLKDRAPEGAVLFTGAVPLPTGHFYEWQQGETVENLLGQDWSELSGAFAALGHPVRLLLLRLILTGVQSTAELQEHEALGTTGQLYHHLRQLVAAGWLHVTGRGHYAVPGARVVPLLTVLTAVQNPA